jgi:hypothetical protein
MTFIELHAIDNGDRLEMAAISLCIRFELDATRLAALERALLATSAHLDGESIRGLREPPARPGVSATLQVTFIHSEPDLLLQRPPIPG